MDIEKYILNHINEEDEVLYELYRQSNLQKQQPRMVSGHLQGQILTMLCQMIKPKKVLEIGTFTGYSAICIAKGIDNTSELHTIEINDENEDFIRYFLKKANVDKKVSLYIGDAINTIPTLMMDFDLTFIDGDKSQYIEYYELALSKTKTGGFIIADNILWSEKVILDKIKDNDKLTRGILEFNDYVQKDKRVENVIFPIRDGLMIIRKI